MPKTAVRQGNSPPWLASIEVEYNRRGLIRITSQPDHPSLYDSVLRVQQRLVGSCNQLPRHGSNGAVTNHINEYRVLYDAIRSDADPCAHYGIGSHRIESVSPIVLVGFLRRRRLRRKPLPASNQRGYTVRDRTASVSDFTSTILLRLRDVDQRRIPDDRLRRSSADRLLHCTLPRAGLRQQRVVCVLPG